MLARYKIYRGQRDPADALPKGVRQDTRWRRTKHPLHPGETMVKEFLEDPSIAAWRAFRRAYWDELERRYAKDRAPFDGIADLAGETDVFFGCSCPTKANPRVDHCHTFVAIEFMKGKYPDLQVQFPQVGD